MRVIAIGHGRAIAADGHRIGAATGRAGAANGRKAARGRAITAATADGLHDNANCTFTAGGDQAVMMREHRAGRTAITARAANGDQTARATAGTAAATDGLGNDAIGARARTAGNTGIDRAIVIDRDRAGITATARTATDRGNTAGRTGAATAATNRLSEDTRRIVIAGRNGAARAIVNEDIAAGAGTTAAAAGCEQAARCARVTTGTTDRLRKNTGRVQAGRNNGAGIVDGYSGAIATGRAAVGVTNDTEAGTAGAGGTAHRLGQNTV